MKKEEKIQLNVADRKKNDEKITDEYGKKERKKNE
jgi:hypothetical protein